MEEFDYLVVGSGSAGAIVAARLSEDPEVTVLLLEAGPGDASLLLRVPAAARYAFSAPKYNWSYETEPEPHLGGRQVPQPRGRVLGGSSSINGMLFFRGHPLDYESWVEMGAGGWSNAEVLPYFRKLESRTGATGSYQGTDGPVRVSTVASLNPLSEAFLEACCQAGYAFTDDVNGFRQEGCGRFPMNAADGIRWSVAHAYLRPARNRRNLTVRTGCHADRVVLEGGCARTVRYRQGGRPCQVRARREIIVSGGAFNSPKLLMLSGLGPADHLRGHGIEVVRDLPGVGQNLMDHSITSIQVGCRKPVSLYRHLNPLAQTGAALRWLVRRDGLLASNHFECGAFLRSVAGMQFPDIQLGFFPISVMEGSKDFMRRHGFQVQISPQRSRSRGRVALASANPDDPPRILFNYLQDEGDRIDLRAGLRLAREILGQAAMAPFHDGEILPGSEVGTDAQIDAYMRAHVHSSYHPCGTCRMGQDGMAVLDPQCRVIGVEGLRVVDASVMPMIPSCNLNGPTMMIGEKAADLIAGRVPLPASNLPYFVDPHWRTRQRSAA